MLTRITSNNVPENRTSFWIGWDWYSECTPKASALFTQTLYTFSAFSPVTVWAVISRFTSTLCGPGPRTSHGHRQRPIQSDIAIYLKSHIDTFTCVGCLGWVYVKILFKKSRNWQFKLCKETVESTLSILHLYRLISWYEIINLVRK